MRLSILVVVFIGAIMTTMVVSGTVGQMVSSAGGGAATSTNFSLAGCEAALGPFTGSGDGASDAARLDPDQRKIAAQIISVGRQRKLPALAWQVAIQAGMTESGLRNLHYGDADSQGIFQMRPSMNWGSVEQITTPDYAINKFYDVLLTVPGWRTQRPGTSSQEVERSAFPDRYHQWEAMAAVLVKKVGDVSDPTGCGVSYGGKLPPPSALAGRAIDFALAQQGKPYVWGGTGPDSFDCSGLVLRAYEAAGIMLPRVADQQYKAGAMLPVRQAKPGDLMFYAKDQSNPATIHHVVMYLGGNKIVEAQQTGVPVHIRSFSFTEGELMAQAVRPGANV